MDIRDLTPNRIPARSGAARALWNAATRLGKDPIALARSVTRRPLTKAELLLVVQVRADELAEKGGRP